MKKSNVLTYLVLAVLFVLLREPFYEMWSGWEPVGRLSAIVPSKLNDAAAMMVIVLGVPAMVVLAQHLSYTGNRWARVFAGSVLYMMVVCRISYGANYTAFATIPWLRYADILIPVLVILWIVSWFEIKKDKNHSKSETYRSINIYYDDLSEVDFLGRGDLAKHLCKHLREDGGSKDSATGIAISGGWGTGKSWVLAHIKQTLEDEGEICLDLKPWLYGETNIARLFYQTLERQLSLHGLRIEELKRAVTEIDNDEIVGFGRALLSLFGIVTKRNSREHTITQIKERLREYDRKIYIFVDDCDRLATKELIQVLSLIRNSGDFPNLTYIMAYDKAIVKKQLEGEDGLNYVGKMINLPIELPPITDEVIGSYLLKSLNEIMGGDVEDPFTRISITRYLPTVREAKRYLSLMVSDYKRRKEVLQLHLYCKADYCLIELLKYKMPDFYYKLMSAPEKYMGKETVGWNSPVWLPREDCFEKDSDGMKLMQAMFRTVNDINDHYGMIGIANREYFPLYFEGLNDSRYVEGQEFTEALDTEKLPQRVGKWIEEGRAGVAGLLGIAQGYVSRKDLFAAMSEYVWHQCEKSKVVNSLSDLTAGYDKIHSRHSYRNIRKIIAETAQLQLLTAQHIEEDSETEDGVEKLIVESGLTLELMGMWMHEMRKVTNLDHPFESVKYYVDMIWKKLTTDLKARDIDTLNMIEILGDSTTEDTFENMVVPLVYEDPQRWLGASVVKVKSGEKYYYLLKSDSVHALFGKQDKMVEEMKLMVAQAKDENKEYVMAYEQLIYRVADMTVNKKDNTIDEKYKTPECVKVEELPALAESKIIGMTPAMPIGRAIEQVEKSAFWKGENIRIHREEPGYYFGTEI